MGFGELFVLALSVSMDAFAVSICKGLCVRKARLKEMAICGAWFGGFQALMPLIGFFLGSLFSDALSSFDPRICGVIAFVLLAIIGINMLREALSKEDCDSCSTEGTDFGFKTMFVMAIATSIDALAVGVSLGLLPDEINIWLAITLIGIFTCLMSGLGVKIGNVFGSRFKKKAEAAGGIVLILLGLKILLENLGILG